MLAIHFVPYFSTQSLLLVQIHVDLFSKPVSFSINDIGYVEKECLIVCTVSIHTFFFFVVGRGAHKKSKSAIYCFDGIFVCTQQQSEYPEIQ